MEKRNCSMRNTALKEVVKINCQHQLLYCATEGKTHRFPWNKNNATLKHKPIFSDVELNSKQIEVDSTLKLIRSTRKNTCQTHLTPNRLKKIVIFHVSMNLKSVTWAYFFPCLLNCVVWYHKNLSMNITQSYLRFL